MRRQSLASDRIPKRHQMLRNKSIPPPIIVFMIQSPSFKQLQIDNALPSTEFLGDSVDKDKKTSIEVESIDQRELSRVTEQKAPGIHVIIISAKGCKPCDKLKAGIKGEFQDYADKARFAEFKAVDEETFNKTVALNVADYPTTIVFKNGKEIGRVSAFEGQKTYQEIKKFLDSAVENESPDASNAAYAQWQQLMQIVQH